MAETAARPATHRRVADAAAALLAEGASFTDLSVEQVIGRAGIARSTFYQHYDDKGALLRALGNEAVGELVSSFGAWSRLPMPIEVDALEQVFTDLAATYRARSEVFAAMAEVAAYDDGVRAEFQLLFDAGKRDLAQHLRRARRAGLTHDTVDPQRTSGWVVWMIERGLYQQIRPASARDVPRQVAALTGIVHHALYR